MDHMPVFAIYKFDFVLSKEGNLFSHGTTDNLIDKAQEIFDGLIKGYRPFPVNLEQNDKTLIPLENEVLAKHNRVALMLVCNEKHKKYQDKKDEKDLEYHPGCYVIIDNRDSIANIAIERISAFDNNPDKVALILQKAINDKLFSEGFPLKIEIRSKVQESTLWQIVEHQVKYYNDRITKVVFSFPVPGKVAGIDAPSEMKDKLAVMSAIASAMNAAKGSYHVEAERGRTLHLEQTQDDLAQMVHLCSRNAYDIQVHFKYYGLYRFGSEEKALSSIHDGIIERFKNGQIIVLYNGTSGFELVQWLDDVRKITENFKHVTPNAKKRKRRNQAEV